MEAFFIKIISLGALLIGVILLSYLIALLSKQIIFYKNIFTKYGLYLTFILSFLATIGSLLMSLYFIFPPCDLCWYQRIFMYSITFISGMAILKKDFVFGPFYSLWLAIIGALISLYHYFIQISGSLLKDSAFCSPLSTGGCSTPDFIEFGFITTPFISLMVFLLIIVSLIYAKRKY